MAESRIPPEIWSGGVVERVLKRKDHGKGYAAWNLRLRPILHLASNYQWKAMLIMCQLHDSTKAFRKWEEELSNRI